MAVDKNKLEEEACVLQFYKIVLSWDYCRILEEAEVLPSYFSPLNNALLLLLSEINTLN